MSDFATVLIEDSRLQITDQVTYGVVAGAAQSTYQQFAATSASSSSLIFNVIVPSEQIVIDKNILFRTTINCTVRVTGVPATEPAFAYGGLNAFQAFPFNHLINTASCSINNSNTSVNQKDVLPAILRLYDRRELNRYRSMTPVALDGAFADYNDMQATTGVAATGISYSNNPLNSYGFSPLDSDFVPRGAFPLNAYQIDHYDAAGGLIDHSVISANVTDVFLIGLSITVTEPMLCLSPFTSTPYGNNQAGLLGINNMNFTLNIDSSFSRLMSASLTGVAYAGAGAYTTTISPGCTIGGVNLQPFVAPQILLNLLTLQPSQYAKIKSRNVLPYYDVPRYLSNPTQNAPMPAYVAPDFSVVPATAGVYTTQTLTSTSLQINVIPDKILIMVRKQMSSQTIKDPDAFLTINSISVSFNNVSGLLSACQAQDLYKISVMNGSNQNWSEFGGRVSAAKINGEGATTGHISLIGTGGSLLVLDPAKNFNLPDFLSNGSLGQFQLQFNINVSNQFKEDVLPEICVICCNSGIFSTMQGASQFNIGLLTKQKILETKSQDAVAAIDTHEYSRLVGGRMDDANLAGLAQLVRKFRHRRGASGSGGAMSGGGYSGGRLSKHLL
jgi:hypothetical protein